MMQSKHSENVFLGHSVFLSSTTLHTCIVFHAEYELKFISVYFLFVNPYCWASRMFPVFSTISNAMIIVLSCCSVTQPWPTPCDAVDWNTPVFP